MTNTVYVFGAGINHGLRGDLGSRPPLASDLFQLALARAPFARYAEVPSWFTPLFDYIEKYWKRTVASLANDQFDLEELFTLLQLQLGDAQANGDDNSKRMLLDIQSKLTSFLFHYLERSSGGVLEPPSLGVCHGASDFVELGRTIWKEKATVITFNYDTLIEDTIKYASGQRPHRSISKQVEKGLQTKADGNYCFSKVPDELLDHSNYNWNPYTAYRVHFDEVMLGYFSPPRYVVSGKTYFAKQNNGTRAPIVLKMHGSLNWGRYSRYLPRKGKSQATTTENKIGKTILGVSPATQVGNHLINAMVVPPVLVKDLDSEIFKEIWALAAACLKKCDRLVVGGYSFPTTDFYTRKLFLEAYSNRSAKEVVVVNPDRSVNCTVRKLTHIDPVWYRDLGDYISAM